MGIGVVEASATRVTLSAPLAPNINHRETVFGGSACALAILSAWTLLYLRLQQTKIDSRVVIQRNTMSYDLPIIGDFIACAALHDEAIWERFIETLRRRTRARISLTAELHCDGIQVGKLVGDYVALI